VTRFLLRLAGGYAWLGALAYLVLRIRYASTSTVREWTDDGARQASEELASLRESLIELRREVRDLAQKQRRRPLAGTPG
jgi:hypothetical protein